MSAVALKILITGPQGSGKTTQAKLLADYLQVPFISIGDLLREMTQMPNEKGKKIKKDLSQGNLADDKFVKELLKKAVTQKDTIVGFVMDGYPRSLNQLKLFDPGFDKAFYLDISDAEVEKRLLKRAREDDTPKIIRRRLVLYHKLTEPVLEYFKNQGILKKINGMGAIDDVQERIKNSLNETKK